MKRIEILGADGAVINTIVADEEFAEAQHPGAWRLAADQPEQVPAPVLRHITRLAFLSRFADAEAVAIDLASIGATPQAAGMRRYMSKVNAATYIDLDRADTRAGVQALEAAGVLAAGRALQILDAPVQPEERWHG
ncbi:hypothetical protein [Simplicispira sedimenti]|uniref:hypothetical protein n=1 Tax=Simplicispira sedimenti TaxID=2919500 RepID=UPI001FA9A8CD|nr:hypothetical protein [Acidovorax sp. W1-6]